MNPLRIGVIDTPKDITRDGLILYANVDYPEIYTDLNGITSLDGNTFYSLIPRDVEIVKNRFYYPYLYTWAGLTFGEEYDFWYDYGIRVNPNIEYQFLEFSGFTNYGVCGGTLYGGTGNTYMKIESVLGQQILNIKDGDLVVEDNSVESRSIFFSFENFSSERNSHGETAFSGAWSFGLDVRRTEGTTGNTGGSVSSINGAITPINLFTMQEDKKFVGVVHDAVPFSTISSARQAPIFNWRINFNGNEYNSYTFKKGITIGYVQEWKGVTFRTNPSFIPNESWDMSGITGSIRDGPLRLDQIPLESFVASSKEYGFLKVKNAPFSIPATIISVMRVDWNRSFGLFPFFGVEHSQYPLSPRYFPYMYILWDPLGPFYTWQSYRPDGSIVGSLSLSNPSLHPWVACVQRTSLIEGNTYQSTVGVFPLDRRSSQLSGGGFNYSGITSGLCDINFGIPEGINSKFYPIKIGTFMLYNRGLSDLEISDIYSFLIERYKDRY